MAFTGTNVKTDIWAYMDESPVDSDIIIAINEALDKLADRALVYAETTQIALADTWYAMPAGFIGIEEVSNAAGEIYRYWRMRGGKIAFLAADTYTIIHTTTPTRISVIGDTIAVHDAYKPAIEHYVEGWLKMMDDDESSDGKRLLAQAEVEFEGISNMLKRGRKQPNRKIRVER